VFVAGCCFPLNAPLVTAGQGWRTWEGPPHAVGNVIASVALALLAASMFATSAALQQRAARRAAREATGQAPGGRWLPVLGVLRRLLRDRRWLAGWVANVAGFGAHAAALHFGSILVVQALMVTQLLLALALGGRRPLRRDWVGTLAICTGLAMLLVVHGGATTHGPVQRSEVARWVLLAGALIVGLVVAARLARRSPQARSALVAVAAGICFSLTAVFVVLVTDDLARGGIGAVLTDWAMLGLAASTSVGGLLAQDAFAAGSLPTALTAMTMADPLTSAAAGAFLFGTGAGAGAGTLAGYALIGLLLATGVALLANSPTLHDERDPSTLDAESPPSTRSPSTRSRGTRSSRRPMIGTTSRKLLPQRVPETTTSRKL
jgi:hypothetical protein